MRKAKAQDPATVLLVEDEPLILMMTADALQDAGFSVLEAWNADEALRLLEERGGNVHVLLTDVNMPGSIDGLALAGRVHERWPRIQLLVTSGQVRPSENDLPDRGRFMPKPYRTSTMLGHIDALMQQGYR